MLLAYKNWANGKCQSRGLFGLPAPDILSLRNPIMRFSSDCKWNLFRHWPGWVEKLLSSRVWFRAPAITQSTKKLYYEAHYKHFITQLCLNAFNLQNFAVKYKTVTLLSQWPLSLNLSACDFGLENTTKCNSFWLLKVNQRIKEKLFLVYKQLP